MNSYLSRAEKETFVRLTSLAGLQEKIIDTYSEGNNVDKGFLRNLRMSKTYLNKALEHRVSFLDESAKIDLNKQVSRLELLFVPNDKAKKELENVRELQSYLHMPLSDFEDWYCEVIEYTCKTCNREDYKECAMRSIMAKYGVFPANPEANGCCQYSYVGVPEENIPVRPEREIEEVLENTELIETKSQENVLIGYPVSLAKSEVAASVPERKAPEGMVPVDIYLQNGNRIEVNLLGNIVNNILKGLKNIDGNNRPIVACHIDNELFAIDTQELVIFRAYGVGEMELVHPIKSQVEREPFTAFTEPPVTYKIECKCGAEYFCKLNKNKYRARCRDCGATVFTDRTAEKDIYQPTGEEATLMTNRYFVEKEPYQATSHERTHENDGSKNINKNLGRGYVDPCNLL